MIKDILNCCHNCPLRTVGCHDVNKCEKWAEHESLRADIKAKKVAEKDAESFFADEKKRKKAHQRKYREGK